MLSFSLICRVGPVPLISEAEGSLPLVRYTVRPPRADSTTRSGSSPPSRRSKPNKGTRCKSIRRLEARSKPIKGTCCKSIRSLRSSRLIHRSYQAQQGFLPKFSGWSSPPKVQSRGSLPLVHLVAAHKGISSLLVEGTSPLASHSQGLSSPCALFSLILQGGSSPP